MHPLHPPLCPRLPIYIASGGKSYAGAILPLVKHDWLKWSHDNSQKDKGLRSKGKIFPAMLERLLCPQPLFCLMRHEAK